MPPNSTRRSPSPETPTGRCVRRPLTAKRRNEIPAKRVGHSARRYSPQPSAGEPFFSPADHRKASGSGARSAVTSSGPEGAPRDPPATELSPDIVALIKRSVDQAAKQAFESRRQFTQVVGNIVCFMFGAGRPASFLLDKNPVNILQDDAIRAFMPYLILTKDEEEQGASGGEQHGDDDGGSYRGTSAAEESKDADDCLDSDDNIFGAGEGLTRCG